jgi:hypothetical protein
MRRYLEVIAIPLLSLAVSPIVRAQDVLVPAGTLFRCTMSEPNFSSATAEVGDPVLCHLASLQQFGRNVFPRGAYMSGHLEADKEPGHFWGKGYMKIVFDRIGTPNADVSVNTKVVGARNYPVNKQGAIKGKGHAKRDVIEWMIPPLWPWKVLMLPARGPRPALKGEQTLTLRLMEDVTIPRTGAAYNSRDWRPPQAQIRQQPASYSVNNSPATAPAMTNTGYVLSVDPAFKERSQTELGRQAVTAEPHHSSSSLTLIALRSETIYAVTDYWLSDGGLAYILPSGTRGSCALNDVDLTRTTQLNSERGITVTFSDIPPAQPSL